MGKPNLTILQDYLLLRMMSRRSVLIGVLLLAVAMALAKADPSPPHWPEQFSADFSVFYAPMGPYWSSPLGGNVTYSDTLRSMRSFYNGWCAPMFDDPPFVYNFTCSFLFAPDKTAYYIAPNDPSPNAPCCVFDTDLPAPNPNFLGDNATYAGSSVERAFPVDWWTKDGTGFGYGTFVLANGTMTPYALWGPLAEGMLEIAYTSFAAGSIDTSLFTLPMECEQAAPCTDSARIRKRAIATHFA